MTGAYAAKYILFLNISRDTGHCSIRVYSSHHLQLHIVYPKIDCEAPGPGFFQPTAAAANPSGCRGLPAVYVPSLHTFDVKRWNKSTSISSCNRCQFRAVTCGATSSHKEPSKSHIAEALAWIFTILTNKKVPAFTWKGAFILDTKYDLQLPQMRCWAAQV